MKHLIILLAGFLRFWRLEERVIFSGEANNVLYTAEKLINGKQSLLLGFEATGYVHHLFTTPWNLYLVSLLLIISRGNPLGLVFFQAAMGVLGTYLIFRVGEILVSEKTGLIAAFLNAVWMTAIKTDLFFSAIGLAPFASIVIMYFFAKAIRSQNKIWFGILGGWLGFSVSMHYQFLITSFIVILWIFTKYRKFFLALLIPFLLSFLPLIIFDLRHQWFNLIGFRLAIKTILAGGSPYSSSHYFYQFHRPILFLGAVMLSKMRLKYIAGFMAFFAILQLNKYFKYTVAPSFIDRKELAEKILSLSGNRYEIYFNTRPSFDYQYLIKYLARQKGIDPQKFVFYEPWQPLNSANITVVNDNEVYSNDSFGQNK